MLRGPLIVRSSDNHRLAQMPLASAVCVITKFD